ncbi:ABC transporter substrate-binding protein [Paenibacillus sp. UMB4589-SE434]|uniref:ABC transporter substrate-binding protein n=1 Tax=Paenibacillus sp. UMB4589-SE434 TaxID=3046314 RepID=UPI00254AAD2F|nr:ABC transporter substrate-binding protein [Paenibacillus sp. UMB4589-SE434]MDK8179729.1 ABC transporter substrate-binding protein [Paenibacillus sp. UMB4589-SE434]
MRAYKRAGNAVVVVVLIMSVVLSACSSSSGAREKVRLGEVARTIFYAPQYVALSQGFFADEGLDVELQTTAGGDKTMTALLSGVIDVALVGSETSIYVYQQGADDPVINFAQLTATDGTFLMARNKQDTFEWNDLKGKAFLGQRKGGMPQMAGEFTLRKHHINPHEDLELIQNIDFANIASAYASGTGEYVQLFEPQASIFEQEGKGHVVASFGVESGKLPYTAYMSKGSFLKKHPSTAQKFTNALYKAQLWVADNSTERIAEAILPYFKDADRNIVIRAVQRYKEQGSYASDPSFDQEEWSNLLDVLRTAGELKQDVAIDKLVDNQYAEHAQTNVK